MIVDALEFKRALLVIHNLIEVSEQYKTDKQWLIEHIKQELKESFNSVKCLTSHLPQQQLEFNFMTN